MPKSEVLWEIGLVQITGELLDPAARGKMSKNYAVCLDILSRLKHKGISKYRVPEQLPESRKLSLRLAIFYQFRPSQMGMGIGKPGTGCGKVASGAPPA
jgi:hypothetical protein